MTEHAVLSNAAAVENDEPPVLDTYAVVYAFILMFLLPAMVLLQRLPFGDDRSLIYSFEYVSLVTVPFVLGLLVTFLTDSDDPLKRKLLRFAILTPLVVLTGVTIMFGASILMLPASKILGIRDQGLSLGWWAGFALVSAPLVIALVRKIRRPSGPWGVVHIVAIALSLTLVIAVAVFSFTVDANIYEIWRKDLVIYVVGALSWYLPSFGIAAGFWRRTGLV